MNESGTGGAAVQVRREPLPMLPSTFDDAWRQAQNFAASGLLPSSLRGKPQDVLVVMLMGRDMGLTPMQALRGVHVIEGKPTMAADLMAAVVRSSGLCEYLTIVESTATVCRAKTKRRGHDEVTASFSFQEAEAAGITGKDNWRKWRQDMLRARCLARLCRMVYQDLLFGVHDPDEVDAEPAPAKPPRGTSRARTLADVSEPAEEAQPEPATVTVVEASAAAPEEPAEAPAEKVDGRAELAALVREAQELIYANPDAARRADPVCTVDAKALRALGRQQLRAFIAAIKEHAAAAEESGPQLDEPNEPAGPAAEDLVTSTAPDVKPRIVARLVELAQKLGPETMKGAVKAAGGDVLARDYGLGLDGLRALLRTCQNVAGS